MGPRPLGRGWFQLGPPQQRLYQRFNGAATARSRMGGKAYPTTSDPRSFNGAATARSRMDLRSTNRALKRQRLQWGRDR